MGPRRVRAYLEWTVPHPRVSLAAAALACATACAAPAGRSPDAATWQLDSVPFVDIGARDDDTLAILGRPHSATLLPDSLVVVGDYQLRELRVFDLAGKVVRTIGRSGEGPGEFRTVSGVHRCGDSLHVYDTRVSLYLVFDSDGGYVRQYRATGPDRFPMQTPFAAACNRSGQFIKHSYWRLQPEGPATVRPSVVLWLSAADGTGVVDLGDFPGPDLHVLPGYGNTGLLPMGRVTLVAIGSDRAYVGTADSSTIHTYRLDGTLLSTITAPFEARAATDADREWFKYLDTLGREQTWKRMEARLWSEARFPERLPAYTALLVDAEDRLWVRSFPRDSSSVVRWVAVDAAGRFQGSVDLPAALEVTEIGPQYILGLVGDPASEVRRVRGYRLRR